jgi:hypothetical protein
MSRGRCGGREKMSADYLDYFGFPRNSPPAGGVAENPLLKKAGLKRGGFSPLCRLEARFAVFRKIYGTGTALKMREMTASASIPSASAS